MDLHLPNDLEAIVQKYLASGAYANPEDVVRRALEILDAEENWSDEERRALDEKIDRAICQMARGEGVPGDEARARLQERKAAWLREHPKTTS